ncbi:MAG: hypothetical protein SGI74_06705 [Oligoflexia bacterium]|nr:hypothetical protein [Oligoflexia bacterium]
MQKIYFIISVLSIIAFGSACGFINYSVNGSTPYFLAVSDIGTHRVLIWLTPPTRNQQAADVVLGQPSMSTGVVNNTPGAAGTRSAQSFFGPRSIFSNENYFFVSDQDNHRILAWNGLPTNTQQAAVSVLGQSTMATGTSDAGGTTGSQGLNTPNNIWVVNGKTFVSDLTNHRVLIWNNIPTSFSQSASLILGQPDFTSAVANNTPSTPGTASNQSLFRPSFVSSDGTKLFVADRDNHRVLIWNSIPTSTQQAAHRVIGQTTMAGVAQGTGPGMSFPLGVTSCANMLMVVDFGNNRVLIWNTHPTNDGQAPDIVLGQPSLTTNTANNTPGAAGTVSASSLSSPTQVFCDGQKVYVADNSNRRILIWNKIPTTNQQAADIVLGQPDMATGTAGTTNSQTFVSPIGLFTNSNQAGVYKPGGY